jgi:hypothetical protein
MDTRIAVKGVKTKYKLFKTMKLCFRVTQYFNGSVYFHSYLHTDLSIVIRTSLSPLPAPVSAVVTCLASAFVEACENSRLCQGHIPAPIRIDGFSNWYGHHDRCFARWRCGWHCCLGI